MSNQSHITSEQTLSVSAVDPLDPSIVLGKLYDAHASFVYRNFRRRGVDANLAEDLTHEVFMISFRLLGQGVRPEFPKAWLYRQLTHVLLNHRRKPEVVELHEEAMQSASPDIAITLDAKRRVASALSQMPEDLCEVFTLIELEGLTAPEMAEVMGLPVNTVYSKLRRARVLFEAIVLGETSDQRPVLRLDKEALSHLRGGSTSILSTKHMARAQGAS